jgi:Fe2+ transport system protein FeoA
LTNLEDIQQDLRVAGVIPGESVRVLGVQEQGPDAIAVTYEAADGSLGRRVLGRLCARRSAAKSPNEWFERQ